jgi:small subunit ribosomal protein S6
MHDYELVAMISPEADEDRVAKIVDSVTQSISSRGGVVEDVKNWGKRKLAYPVKRFMEADYVLARFKLTPKSVRDLESEIGTSGDILRYLVVKVGG